MPRGVGAVGVTLHRKGAQSDGAPVHFRISELAEAAGVSRDMVKYYLRAGLLPRAEKPRLNLSLYTRTHLQLIELILRFQSETTLSLQDIGDLFQRLDYAPAAIEMELLSGRHAAADRDPVIPFDQAQAEGVTSAAPPAFIEQLMSAGLLPAGDSLDEHGRARAAVLWAAHEQGIPLSYFRQALDKLMELADLEVKTLIGIKRPGLDYGQVIESVSHADRLINRWLISEKNALARQHFRRIMDNSEKALSTIHEAIYHPSGVFRKRFDIDAQLLALDKATAARSDQPSALRTAAFSCLLLADLARTTAYADALLQRSPGDAVALACKCLAAGMAGDLDSARAQAQRLEELDSRHPLAMEARLLTLLMSAARLGGMSDASELLKDAQQLFLEPVAVDSSDVLDRYEAVLLEARANALFPDAINRGAQSVTALEALLERLQSDDPDVHGLPADGVRMVLQIYTHFCLGQLNEIAGRTERAREHYDAVIRIDPSSNFGEAAYLKHGD
tara:strand:- start:370 stop:1881 length:1512 start_codon:yes stop_codon:yes gene_type:complete